MVTDQSERAHYFNPKVINGTALQWQKTESSHLSERRDRCVLNFYVMRFRNSGASVNTFVIPFQRIIFRVIGSIKREKLLFWKEKYRQHMLAPAILLESRALVLYLSRNKNTLSREARPQVALLYYSFTIVKLGSNKHLRTQRARRRTAWKRKTSFGESPIATAEDNLRSLK